MGMSDESMEHVLQGIEPMLTAVPNVELREHLRSMLPRMRPMINKPEKREKFMRWLGFLQGALWSHGVSLERLKRMNMPPDAEFEASR